MLLSCALSKLKGVWSEVSYRMAAQRDNPGCAIQEFEKYSQDSDPGLSVSLSFDPSDDITAPFLNIGSKPLVAVLREQGVNSQVEMAAAFDRAGFSAKDIHMSDLLAGHHSLEDFHGLVACGGFSYGDVLGAGEGWAKTILFNNYMRDQFTNFFARSATFTLGVCNGCQMLSSLKELIPGTKHWPKFVRNTSEQFEARFSLVKVESSPSALLRGMQDSYMPIVISHGEGRAEFSDADDMKELNKNKLVALRFVENTYEVASSYPSNPNGSPDGLTGLCSLDGRVTIMMPHPERVFRYVTNSWYPKNSGSDSGWMRLFRNARLFVG